MKNKLQKSVAILLVVMMISFICNVSFASSFTATNIKTSLEKCLGKDIIIKGSDSSITTLSNALESTIITDSKISGKVEGQEYSLFNYSVADNVCTFDANVEEFYKLLKIDTSKASKEDLTSSATAIAFVYYLYMEQFYISTADALQKDLSTSFTYFMQKLEEITATEGKVDTNINNEIFSLVIKSNSKNVLENLTLKIYLDKLSNLSEANINKKKTTYKVFLGELPDSEKESISAEYKIDTIKNRAYTGKAIKPAVKLLEKQSGLDSYLEQGTNYTVSYSNNTNVGKATATVTGIGFYKGKITKTFYIVPKKVTGVTNKAQGQTAIVVKWDKATGATGYELEKYDTSKKKYVKVTSKEIKTNTYKVTGLKAATTYKFRVRAYKTIDKKKYYGSYSAVTKLTTKTKTPSISRLTTSKKKATVRFKKVTGASGYQIQYSTDKNFKKNNKTVNASKKSTSKTISKLKSKKKYYFRIRTYRTENGKKVWSSYSSVRNIKIK